MGCTEGEGERGIASARRDGREGDGDRSDHRKEKGEENHADDQNGWRKGRHSLWSDERGAAYESAHARRRAVWKATRCRAKHWRRCGCKGRTFELWKTAAEPRATNKAPECAVAVSGHETETHRGEAECDQETDSRPETRQCKDGMEGLIRIS